MIAFVLSGGGNRGALQVGALHALAEARIVPDLIVGTSIGAVNGVALGSDPTVDGVRRLAVAWRRVRRENVFPGNTLTASWRVLTKQGSLHGQGNFHRYVRTMFPSSVQTFGDLRVPCIVTATVLGSGELRLFGADPSEPIMGPLMASTAIPPFFPPHHYRDEWLVDGAVVTNLPLGQAISRGARTIFALEIVGETTVVSGRNLGQTLASSLRAMIQRQCELERHVTMIGQRGVTIHTINLLPGRLLAYNDFRSTAALITCGYEAATSYLSALPAPAPQPHERIARMIGRAVRGAFTRRAPAPPSAPLPPPSTSATS